MADKKPEIIVSPRGLMSRLSSNVRGNTLFVGGIDISRMYLAKARLQHDCASVGQSARPVACRTTFLAVHQI